MLLLFLYKPFAQVILRCERQTDCMIDKYCNRNNLCNTCLDITTTHCDSLNGCCNIPFHFQCKNSVYNCATDISNKSEMNGLDFFLYFFIVVSFTYLFIGCYYNVSAYNRKGWDIIPHRRYWSQLFSLVKDGIYFTYSIIRRKIYMRYYSLE